MRQVVGIREAWREVSLAGGFDAYIISYGVADLAAITVCRDIRRLDPHGPICFYVDVEESVHRSRAIEAGADSYVLRENGPEVLRDELQRLLLRADADAISAKVAEAAAIEEELNRRAALARERVQHAQQRSADAAARMVQAKAMRAFFEAKGSRAAFERYWPNVFDTAYRKIHPGQ